MANRDGIDTVNNRDDDQLNNHTQSETSNSEIRNVIKDFLSDSENDNEIPSELSDHQRSPSNHDNNEINNDEKSEDTLPIVMDKFDAFKAVNYKQLSSWINCGLNGVSFKIGDEQFNLPGPPIEVIPVELTEETINDMLETHKLNLFVNGYSLLLFLRKIRNYKDLDGILQEAITQKILNYIVSSKNRSIKDASVTTNKEVRYDIFEKFIKADIGEAQILLNEILSRKWEIFKVNHPNTWKNADLFYSYLLFIFDKINVILGDENAYILSKEQDLSDESEDIDLTLGERNISQSISNDELKSADSQLSTDNQVNSMINRRVFITGNKRKKDQTFIQNIDQKRLHLSGLSESAKNLDPKTSQMRMSPKAVPQNPKTPTVQSKKADASTIENILEMVDEKELQQWFEDRKRRNNAETPAPKSKETLSIVESERTKLRTKAEYITKSRFNAKLETKEALDIMKFKKYINEFLKRAREIGLSDVVIIEKIEAGMVDPIKTFWKDIRLNKENFTNVDEFLNEFNKQFTIENARQIAYKDCKGFEPSDKVSRRTIVSEYRAVREMFDSTDQYSTPQQLSRWKLNEKDHTDIVFSKLPRFMKRDLEGAMKYGTVPDLDTLDILDKVLNQRQVREDKIKNMGPKDLIKKQRNKNRNKIKLGKINNDNVTDIGKTVAQISGQTSRGVPWTGRSSNQSSSYSYNDTNGNNYNQNKSTDDNDSSRRPRRNQNRGNKGKERKFPSIKTLIYRYGSRKQCGYKYADGKICKDYHKRNKHNYLMGNKFLRENIIPKLVKPRVVATISKEKKKRKKKKSKSTKGNTVGLVQMDEPKSNENSNINLSQNNSNATPKDVLTKQQEEITELLHRVKQSPQASQSPNNNNNQNTKTRNRRIVS